MVKIKPDATANSANALKINLYIMRDLSIAVYRNKSAIAKEMR
jgi:hypothetical protein